MKQRACHHFEPSAHHPPLSSISPNLPIHTAEPLHSTSYPNLRIDTARTGSSLDQRSPDLSSTMTSDSCKSPHLRGMPQHPSIAFPLTIHTDHTSKTRSLVIVHPMIHDYLQVMATVGTATRHRTNYPKPCVLPCLASKRLGRKTVLLKPDLPLRTASVNFDSSPVCRPKRLYLTA